jgi:phosphoribosyl 1,2-cyclic phosphodiesterase
MLNIQTLASSSAGNCYSLSTDTSKLFVEAGLPINQIKSAVCYTVQDYYGCLVSHEHQDHAKGAEALMKAGVDCYMSQGTADALGLSGHRLHIVKAMKQFRIDGGWTVLPFDTVHDCAEPLGFLIAAGGEKVLFATDTAYLKYTFTGLTKIMIECNYSKEALASSGIPAAQKSRLMLSHFGLDNVLDFLNANDLSKLKEVWLLHLSDRHADEGEIFDAVSKATEASVYVTTP